MKILFLFGCLLLCTLFEGINGNDVCCITLAGISCECTALYQCSDVTQIAGICVDPTTHVPSLACTRDCTMQTWAIAVIAVVIFVFVASVIGCIICCVRRSRHLHISSEHRTLIHH